MSKYDEYVPGPHEAPLRDPPVIDGVLQPHEYEFGGFQFMGDCNRCGHVRDSPIHVEHA